MMDDDMIPDNEFNAFLDSVPPIEEAPNVVPFRPKGESKAQARPDLPVIELEAGELHNIATAAEKALIAAAAPFYVRSQKLMRPVVDTLPASHGRTAKVARLTEVSAAAMVDHLSRTAVWLKYDGRTKKMVSADPTPQVAVTVLSRDGEWTFPRLAGVITTPTLRPDGTILSTPGYDPATQLLLIDPPVMPRLPPRPSKAVGAKALARLDQLLDEFPFVDAASRSVALSALITPVVRGALMVAPMHVTKAPVAGSGKSYIIDLASALNSGERAPVMSAGVKEEELEKRLAAALMAGQTFISLDNVNGELGGDFLCQVIERPVVQPRILGKSEAPKIDSRASCFATGNNIRLVGDMVRRVVLCSLDPDMERPETRRFERKPFDEILSNRGLYVAAALTVVRSYVVAGCPNELPPLASFEDWSRLVRSALVWLGKPDPVETMNAAREDDPTTAALTALFTSWYDAMQSNSHTAAEVVNAANSEIMGQASHLALREALLEVAEDRRGGISTKSLGKYLAKYKNRKVAGLKLTEGPKDSDKKVLTWGIVREV
jgi:putative DNA primase/helicase